MQQTALDRWLRRKYVYINRIYCNVLPDDIPAGVDLEEAHEESGGRFRYMLTPESDDILSDTVEEFRLNNITFTSRVDNKDGWLAKWLNRPNKSVTYEVAWIVMLILVGAFCASPLPNTLYGKLMADEIAEEEEAAAIANAEDGPDNDIKVYHIEDKMFEIDRREE